MTVAAGALPALSNTGCPPQRTTRGQRRRLATALVELGGLPYRAACEVIAGRASLGETPDEIEAYLRATFRMDPTGVTAVRNADRRDGGPSA